MTAVFLAHPYEHHRAREVIELDDVTAGTLVRAGYARRLEDVIVDTGGGWFEVPLRAGVKKVRGFDKARKALERDGRRR